MLRQEHGYKPLLLTDESSEDRGVDQAHNHCVVSVPPISWVQSVEAPKEDIAMATCDSAERNPSLTDNSNYNA